MTLLDHLHSLRHAAAQRIDADLWPRTARVDELGRLCLGHVPLPDVAAGFGTPVTVIDEADVRRRWRAAPAGAVAAAGLAIAAMRWADAEGLAVSVRGRRDLAGARAAGVRRVIVHGDGLDHDDLLAAARTRPERFVVSAAQELAYLGGAVDGTRILLRCFAGGPDPGALELLLGVAPAAFAGLHAVVGDEAGDDAGAAVRAGLAALAAIRRSHGLLLPELGLTATASDTLAAEIEDALDDGCAAARLPRPRLAVELAAPLAGATISVHRVLAVTSPPGACRRAVLDGPLDGSLDGPGCGPAAVVALANRHPLGSTENVDVRGGAGRLCAELPLDLHAGDLLAVTGAPVPGVGAVVAVAHGATSPMLRARALADELARDPGSAGDSTGDYEHPGGVDPQHDRLAHRQRTGGPAAHLREHRRPVG